MHFAHTWRGFQRCRWCDIIASSSTPISLIQNLFSQNQLDIASTGKQFVMVGRPELLFQSLPSFRYRLSVVYHKSQNVLEHNCNVYWSKVWIQLTSKLMCAFYSTTVPFSNGQWRGWKGSVVRGSEWQTLLEHPLLIEWTGICVLSLVHGSELRGSDVYLHIGSEKK